MRKLLLVAIALILFWSIDTSNGFINYEPLQAKEEAEILVAGFEASGANFLELNTNTTLHLPNQFYTMEEMLKIKKDLIDKLALNGELKVVSNEEHYNPYFMAEDDLDENVVYLHINEEEGYNQITATAIDSNGDLIVFILYSSHLENQKESYIIIDMVKNKGYIDIVDTSTQHRVILKNYGESIQNTITIVGTIGGNIPEPDKSQWINSITKALKADTVEKVSDDNYISITLFSRILPKGILYGNKQVNLQLATRYNKYEDKTYLWIATPLITNTY